MKNFLIFMGMIILVLGLWIGSFFLIDWYIQDANKAGVFGDQFGAINALFSGLAFAGLIYTILLQRDELLATQEEIRNQTKEFEKQNETLALQRFEMSFFNMLSMFNSILEKSQIKLKNEGHEEIPYMGRAAFVRLYAIFKSHFSANRMYPTPPSEDDKIATAFRVIFNDTKGVLSQYFRLTYRIIKFILESDLTDGEKSRYFKIFRSLLSDSELLILFYNCTFYDKGKSFKEMLEKSSFELFDNLPWQELIHPIHLKKMKVSVYGELASNKEFLEAYNKTFDT